MNRLGHQEILNTDTNKVLTMVPCSSSGPTEDENSCKPCTVNVDTSKKHEKTRITKTKSRVWDLLTMNLTRRLESEAGGSQCCCE